MQKPSLIDHPPSWHLPPPAASASSGTASQTLQQGGTISKSLHMRGTIKKEGHAGAVHVKGRGLAIFRRTRICPTWEFDITAVVGVHEPEGLAHIILGQVRLQLPRQRCDLAQVQPVPGGPSHRAVHFPTACQRSANKQQRQRCGCASTEEGRGTWSRHWCRSVQTDAQRYQPRPHSSLPATGGPAAGLGSG